MNIYVLKNVPGAHDTTEWTAIPEIAAGRRFVYINHQPRRATSRWVSVEAKRPFEVREKGRGCSLDVSKHATLEAAYAAADRWVSRRAPEFYGPERVKRAAR